MRKDDLVLVFICEGFFAFAAVFNIFAFAAPFFLYFASIFFFLKFTFHIGSSRKGDFVVRWEALVPIRLDGEEDFFPVDDEDEDVFCALLLFFGFVTSSLPFLKERVVDSGSSSLSDDDCDEDDFLDSASESDSDDEHDDRLLDSAGFTGE